MANGDVAKFFEAVSKDPVLKAKLQKANGLGGVARIARDQGFAFTEDDLDAFQKTHDPKPILGGARGVWNYWGDTAT